MAGKRVKGLESSFISIAHGVIFDNIRHRNVFYNVRIVFLSDTFYDYDFTEVRLVEKRDW